MFRGHKMAIYIAYHKFQEEGYALKSTVLEDQSSLSVAGRQNALHQQSGTETTFQTVTFLGCQKPPRRTFHNDHRGA